MDSLQFSGANMILKCFKYNQHFVAMMNIINLARIRNVDGNFERHHVIPRCFFNVNNLPVDNSEANLVNLTLDEHRKVHQLIPLCANDCIATRMNRCKGLMNGTRWTGGHLDEEWRKNISNALKGKKIVYKNPNAVSQTRSRIAKSWSRCKGLWGINAIPGHPATRGSKGMHWWNNGIDNVLSLECPEGYKRGRINASK